MLTLAEAKELQYGDILLDSHGKRWKVNGQVKTWKKDAHRIRVPLKHGLYAYDALTEADFRVHTHGVDVFVNDELSKES